MARPQRNDRQKKSRRIFKNEDIKAFKILVLDDEGNQLGEMSRAKALQVAGEKGMDLVQIHYDPDKKVCTAKIIDFGKYQYEKKKQESEKRKTQKKKIQKEIKFGYNIGDNDLKMKFNKAVEFLGKGHPVKINVVLRGREKVYKDIVRAKLDALEEKFKEHGKSLGVKNENFGFSLVILSSQRGASSKKPQKRIQKKVIQVAEDGMKKSQEQRPVKKVVKRLVKKIVKKEDPQKNPIDGKIESSDKVIEKQSEK